MGFLIFFIGIVSLIFTISAIVVAIIGVLIAAFQAASAAIATKQNTMALLLRDIRKTYASPEMLQCMHNLIDWYKDHGKENFAKVFAKLRSENYKKVKKLDQDRRRFAHWLIEIYQFYDLKIIDEKFVALVATITAANFAITVIEPMEEAINSKYNKAPFDLLRSIYGCKLTGELLHLAYGKENK